MLAAANVAGEVAANKALGLQCASFVGGRCVQKGQHLVTLSPVQQDVIGLTSHACVVGRDGVPLVIELQVLPCEMRHVSLLKSLEFSERRFTASQFRAVRN